MDNFTTLNTIFWCVEVAAMIAATLLSSSGKWNAVLPILMAFFIILNLHNVTLRRIKQ